MRTFYGRGNDVGPDWVNFVNHVRNKIQREQRDPQSTEYGNTYSLVKLVYNGDEFGMTISQSGSLCEPIGWSLGSERIIQG